MAKIKKTVYLHGSKEEMFDLGEELGLEGDALSNFGYALYEVGLELEIDTGTGDYTIVNVTE